LPIQLTKSAPTQIKELVFQGHNIGWKNKPACKYYPLKLYFLQVIGDILLISFH
jgi:hypothetical protein